MPIVEEQRGTRALPTGRTAPKLRAPRLNVDTRGPVGIDAIGRAQQNLANSFGDVADAFVDVAADMKKRGDQIRLIEAQRQLDEYELTNFYDGNSGTLSRKGKDAFGLPQQAMGEYNAFGNELRESLGNDDQRIAFDKMFLSRRRTNEQMHLRHERQQMEVYAKSQVDAAVDSSLSRAAQFHTRPEIVNTAIKSAQDVAGVYGRMNGMPDEAIKNQQLEIASKAHLAVLTRQVDTNPNLGIQYFNAKIGEFTGEDLLRAQRLIGPAERHVNAHNVAQGVLGGSTPTTTQTDMINFVINDLEGGEEVVPDGGGIAKFGVNSVANPDVDVKNLSAEEARSIYRTRYWDAIGADSLPADLRLVAFDAAVNHGVGKAKELLEKSGGDARKMLELRAAEYDRLARENPEKFAQHLDGWKNRLAKVSGQIDTMRGELPSEAELMSRIDAQSTNPEVANDAKKIVKAQLAAIKADRKQREDAASDEAWSYVQQGQPVPASVEARMNPKEAVQMRNSVPFDGALYERTRAAVLTGQPVDLSSMRWQLGNKFDELVKLQQDPTKRLNSRKVDDVIKSQIGILIGKSTPKNEKEFATVERFRRVVDDEIEAFQKTSGKPATADDVQKITDRLMLEVEKDNFFGSDVRAFELEPGEEFEVEGIPLDRQYFVLGEEVAYSEVIRNLTLYLESRNLPVNPENLRNGGGKPRLSKGR